MLFQAWSIYEDEETYFGEVGISGEMGEYGLNKDRVSTVQIENGSVPIQRAHDDTLHLHLDLPEMYRQKRRLR